MMSQLIRNTIQKFALCAGLFCVSAFAFAQQNITGTVVDATGQPVISASVMVPRTTIGVVTDLDGHFSLSIPTGTQLVVSCIGYVDQSFKVTPDRTAYRIVLKENAEMLEETVVVGYGTQKKESVVGSIAQVDNKSLVRTSHSSDLSEGLVGQVPGLVSLTSSGEPGGILTGESATNLFIRGRNTWNGGGPLVLVDGVERNMSNVDPNEVELVSVLKDASATAVFGVKGANGVILITTKRGKEGKTTLNFDYTVTGSMLSKQPEKLNSYDAMMIRNESIEREVVLNESSWMDYYPYDIISRFRQPQSAENAAIYPDVDWQKAMYDDMGFSHRFNISAQGGNRIIRYFGALSYLREGDMFRHYDNFKTYDPNYNFDRFNFRSNIDIAPTKTTDIKINLSGYYSLKNTNFNNEGTTDRADYWMWASTYILAPNLFQPRFSDGYWGCNPDLGSSWVNPMAVVYNLGIRQTRVTQLDADFQIEQKLDFITKGLKASGLLSYDNSIRSQGGIYDFTTGVNPLVTQTNVHYRYLNWLKYKGPDQDPAEYTSYYPVSDTEYDWVMHPWKAQEEEIKPANWANYVPVFRRMLYQLQLNYARRFGKHDVTGMGVFKREEYANGSEFPHFREDWVFRAAYGYDNRYLVEANGAYNGSEQFGPGYRFEFFPSVALGWYLSNEKFFRLKWMNKAKFRFSYGTVGDDKISSRWQYASQYAFGGRSRLNHNPDQWSPYPFYRETVVGNPDIHWEVAEKINYGIELAFLKDFITLNVDYFKENRRDILLSTRNIPPFFGATAPSANLGRVKSSGFEIELGVNRMIGADLFLWGKLTLNHNQNTVIARDDAPLQYAYLKYQGFQIGQSRSQIRTGFYNNWDEVFASVPTETNDNTKLPGYYNLLDFNGDGIIKSKEDTPPIGYSEIPQNTGSITLGADYKGLSLMVQFIGANNASRWVAFNNFLDYTDIVYGHVRDYWTKENPNASSFLPRWRTAGENIGDYYLYDASFVRLQTVELSYTMKNMSFLKKAGCDNLRIFLNGNNLFFWSDLPDDRTTTYASGSASQGSYPTLKRINLGINLTF